MTQETTDRDLLIRIDERVNMMQPQVSLIAGMQGVVSANAQAIERIDGTLKRHNMNGATPKRAALLLAWMPIVKQIVHFVMFFIVATAVTAGYLNLDVLGRLWSMATTGQLGAQ
jgi:hypothetical protein